MQKRRSTLLLGIVLFTSVMQLFGQETVYKKTIYSWDPSMLDKIIPETKFANEDAIILDRKITAKLPEFENNFILTFNKNFYLSTTSRILIKSATGAKKFASLYLPEAPDPLINPSDKKFCYGYMDWYNVIYNYRIMQFAVRIIKPDGKIVRPSFSDINEIDSIYNGVMPSPRIRTHFKIEGLVAGDELQMHYKIEIPIQNKLAYRFFFNDFYPIQKLNLNVSYLTWTRPLIEFKNGAESQYDSLLSIVDDQEKKTFIWNRKNLSGYNYNSNYATCKSVAYADFEVFSGVNGNMYLINDWVTSLSNSHVTFNECIKNGKIPIDSRMIWFEYYVNFQHKKSDKEYYLSKTTEQNLGYRHFYKTVLEDSSVTNDYLKMIKIHDKLNELAPLDYKDTWNDAHKLAIWWFNFLERKLFRTDYAEYIYTNLFARIDSAYYYVLLPDKRYKLFNEQTAGITTPAKGVFAFKMNSNYYYLYPQNKYAKYYLNELPFYFENELVMHIPQNLPPIQKCSDIKSNTDIIYKYTPGSQLIDNYRQIAGAININLKSKSLDFKGKISLSGQYSTLLRNFYQNNLIDPTINELYKKRMSDAAIKNSINYTLTSASKDFPFKTYYSGNFSISNVCSEQNGNFTLPVTNWFNYIYPDTAFVNSSTTNFDFYPDFLNNDKFKYQLTFTEDVEISNLADFNLELHNDYADFQCRLQKIDSKNYLLDSFLEIKKDKVPAHQINQVEEVSRALVKLTSNKIILKTI